MVNKGKMLADMRSAHPARKCIPRRRLHVEDFKPGAMLSSGEAANLFGVHLSTLRTWCRDGLLPHQTTIGGHRRVAIEDVAEAIKKAAVPTGGDKGMGFRRVTRAVRRG